MQLGFEQALFESAVTVHQRLKGDIMLINPHWSMLAQPKTFPRRRLYQALGFAGVESVTSVQTMIIRWKNPETGTTREMFMMGIDPSADVVAIPEVTANRHLIRYPDVVLYDEASRPEFGRVAARFRAGETVSTEANQHRVTVGGLFRLGTSFGVDGSIITSDSNFLRIVPGRAPGALTIGLVRLRPGTDARAVRDALAAQLPKDVAVLTRQQYFDREVDYWATNTPIGYVFAFGVVIGLVVGSIVVYQILFADISDHLPEYATLKAMGYTNRYLAGVVLMEALLLGVLGFIPGLAICWWLYGMTRSATMLPMQMTVARSVLVLALTVGMCWVSGAMAMRKLRAADPAEVF
jgi:putative ABC transport system permease protein